MFKLYELNVLTSVSIKPLRCPVLNRKTIMETEKLFGECSPFIIVRTMEPMTATVMEGSSAVNERSSSGCRGGLRHLYVWLGPSELLVLAFRYAASANPSSSPPTKHVQ